MLLAAVMAAVAAPVSLEQARAEAMKALGKARLNAPAKDGAAAGAPQLTLAKQAVGTKGKAVDATLYYVFNNGDGGGMVVVAGDDRVRPILAYTDEGGYAEDAAHPGVRWWFGAVEAAMTSIVGDSSPAGMQAVAAKSYGMGVKPMVQTQWGQDEPYNMLCPYDQGHGGRSLTGCVATAMAQVMYYWGYPAHGTGTVSYTTGTHNFAITENLEDYVFDYERMTLDYSDNSDEYAKQAVATLMYACGVGTEMDYCTNASGASLTPAMLIGRFNFDQSCTHIYREHFTTAEWEGIIRRELDEGRPVLYSGNSQEGGHLFICDGYDETGLYHINWGWSGLLDGYYDLAVLNPEDIAGEGFSFNQDIIYGIKPAGHEGETAYENNMYYDALENLTHRTVLPGGVIDYNVKRMTCRGKDFNGYVGTALYDKDGNLADGSCIRTQELPADYYFESYQINYTLPGGLPDGTYTLRPVSGPEPDEWQPMKGVEGAGLVTTLVVTVAGGSATVTEGEVSERSLSLAGGVNISGGSAYAGYTAEADIPIRNDGDYFNGIVYVKNTKRNHIIFEENITVDHGETAVMLASLPFECDAAEEEFLVYFDGEYLESDTVGLFTVIAQQPATGAPEISVKGITLDKTVFTTDEELVAHVELSNSGGFYEGYALAFVHFNGYTWTFYGDELRVNKGESKTGGVKIDTKYMLEWHGVDEMTGTITPGYYDPATGRRIEGDGEVAFSVTKSGEAPATELSLDGGVDVDGGRAYTGLETAVSFTLANNGSYFSGTVGIAAAATGEAVAETETAIDAGRSSTFTMTFTAPGEPGRHEYEVYYENLLGERRTAGTFTLDVEQTAEGSPAVTVDSLRVLTPDVGTDGMLRFRAYLGNSGGFYKGVIRYNILLVGLNGGGTGGTFTERDVTLNGGDTHCDEIEQDLSTLIERLNIVSADGQITTYYVDPATGEYVVAGPAATFTVNQPTGISTAEAEGENAPVYTISGLRAGTTADLKSLPKGIYVTGGRKIIVK